MEKPHPTLPASLLALLAVLPAPTLAQEQALATVEVVDQFSAQVGRKDSAIQKIVIAEEADLRRSAATAKIVFARKNIESLAAASLPECLEQCTDGLPSPRLNADVTAFSVGGAGRFCVFARIDDQKLGDASTLAMCHARDCFCDACSSPVFSIGG